jgi:hypothetical protein
VKIVVICGHPYSGFQLAYETLTLAGLGRSQLSRHESLSSTELHEKIYKAHDLDPTGLNVNAPIRPGKVWQDLAVDLFMGNMEQKNWGWADDKSVWLLEFWKELDPQVHFVLVYSMPEYALGEALKDGHVNPDEIESVLASWIACHTEMLRFYNRNPGRSLLVNAATTIHDPKTLIEKTINTFGMNLILPSSEQPAGIDSVSAIAATLAKALIEDDNEAYALYRELESAADIADPHESGTSSEKRQALEEFTALLARLDKEKLQISENAQYINKLLDEQTKLTTEFQFKIQQLTKEREDQTKLAITRQTEIQQLTQARDEQIKLALERQTQIQQLMRTQNENENIKEEYTRLTRQLNDCQAELKDGQAIALSKQGQLTQENELLLLQLHQVQEELERYFLQGRELTQERDEQAKLATEWQAQIQQLIQVRDEQVKVAAEGRTQIQKLTQERDEQAKQSTERQAQGNELLLLQLHQVQEELEHYFLQWQELSAKDDSAARATTFINRFWRKHQPSEIVIDFRDEIEGYNWYDAELDGRWAGPGKVSTVKLPALRKGRYELYLDIVDAQAPEIITDMDMSLNGNPLQTTVDGEGYPAMVFSEFAVENAAQQPVWEFQFKFPKLISPAQHGSTDNRHLAIRVRTLKLRVTS